MNECMNHSRVLLLYINFHAYLLLQNICLRIDHKSVCMLSLCSMLSFMFTLSQNSCLSLSLSYSLSQCTHFVSLFHVTFHMPFLPTSLSLSPYGSQMCMRAVSLLNINLRSLCVSSNMSPLLVCLSKRCVSLLIILYYLHIRICHLTVIFLFEL
jgi:hypothetical protein